MGVIDIGTVLSKFDDKIDEIESTVKSYWIRFITSDGRVRTMHARKGVKSPQRELVKPLEERGRQMFNLKRNGTMLVHDMVIDKPRTVKVANIFSFKDFNSTTWVNVRH